MPQKPVQSKPKPGLTDAQWEVWEEWLAHPQTRALLSSLKRQSESMQGHWKDSVWQGTDPAQLADLRAQSLVYQGLSQMDRQLLSDLDVTTET